MADNTSDNNDRVALVACQVMEPELEWVRKDYNHVSVLYLDQGLHRTPQLMADQVQALVDQAAETADRIVLAA